MTPAQLLRDGIARLNAAGIPGAPRDARLLLAHALGIGADRLGVALGDALPRDAADAFESAIARRAAREPISHITGRRLFWGRAFHVSADVLDPRPETETLIAACLEAPFQRVLDLGTGSGAITIALAHQHPEHAYVALDRSPAALRAMIWSFCRAASISASSIKRRLK